MRLVIPACLVVFLTLPAVAQEPAEGGSGGERGLVAANNVNVYQEPQTNSDSLIKLYVGRMVRVVDHKEGWLQVQFDIERGPDKIPMSGWVELKNVRATSRHGFSFQRGQVPPPDSGAADSDPGKKSKKSKKKDKKKKKGEEDPTDTPAPPIAMDDEATGNTDGSMEDDGWGDEESTGLTDDEALFEEGGDMFDGGGGEDTEGWEEDDWGDEEVVDDPAWDTGGGSDDGGDDWDTDDGDSGADDAATPASTPTDETGDTADDDWGDEGDWGDEEDWGDFPE